ncbi:MAG TPA: tRNA (uridine(34)/cytosine(34)/5-carboxymethylaminomethyluridine(34)-2'-O)-methyltransferase TrmL [Burkholderiales bacterium]
MVEIALVHPEIPPNAGNVIRLAANTGARLHFIQPLGFSLDDKQLRRAGLDYHEYARVKVHASWKDFSHAMRSRRMFAFTTKGSKRFTDVRYAEGDILVFGAETSGLPAEALQAFKEENRLRLPMQPGNRSLNLSNAVAVAVFEAWRQLGFPGGR